MVNLRFENGQFLAVFAYNETIKNIVKSAGFRWDPGRKVWWTGDVDKALNLAQDIDLPEEQVKLLTGRKLHWQVRHRDFMNCQTQPSQTSMRRLPWVLTSIRISVLSANLRV